MKKFLSLTLIQICMATMVAAQGSNLDFLRSTGKIYAVVAVIVIIFIGILYFLYRLDTKLTKLEKQLNNEQ